MHKYAEAQSMPWGLSYESLHERKMKMKERAKEAHLEETKQQGRDWARMKHHRNATG